MKNILVAGLLIYISTLAGQSQELYSQKNLEQASGEDLFLYLKKAQKLERTGGILLIAVPVTAITGVVLASVSQQGGTESTWRAGLGLVMGSLGFAAVGIPTFAIGASRVKKVTNLLSPKFSTALIDFFPSSQYDYQSHNIQPGITLRIRF